MTISRETKSVRTYITYVHVLDDPIFTRTRTAYYNKLHWADQVTPAGRPAWTLPFLPQLSFFFEPAFKIDSY